MLGRVAGNISSKEEELKVKGEWKAKSLEWHDRAERLRQDITKTAPTVEGSEEDYDELIMFWSR